MTTIAHDHDDFADRASAPQLLADDLLDAVAAGMDCTTAAAVAKAYGAAGDVMRAVGYTHQAVAFTYTAEGVKLGACH